MLGRCGVTVKSTVMRNEGEIKRLVQKYDGNVAP